MLAAGPLVSEATDQDSRALAPLRRWREVELGSSTRPGERSGASGVVYQDALYVFGGYGGSGRLDDIFKFDFQARYWKQVHAQGATPVGRENNGAVVHGNKMYLFGGYSGFTWLNDFLAFNFDTCQWSTVPSGQKGAVPSTRFGYVSSGHGDFMYVFGGYDGSAWLNDTHDFDYERGLWSATNVQGFIPSGRSCPSWATHKGSVYQSAATMVFTA